MISVSEMTNDKRNTIIGEKKMCKVFGYARISTKKQSIDRQIRNIKEAYPDAKIYKEAYTGTKMDRPQWGKLIERVEEQVSRGEEVTLVFDQVSRMSRNSQEGVEEYFRLFNLGVNLIFIKEPAINSEAYRQSVDFPIKLDLHVGENTESKDSDDAQELVNGILAAVSKYLSKLAKRQVIEAFEASQKEVDDLHVKTSEGLETARQNGKQVGQKEGIKLSIKKKEPVKQLIKKYSKDFDGNLNDGEVMGLLASLQVKVGERKELNPDTMEDEIVPEMKSAKLARNTYYAYKKELLEEIG